MIGLHWKLTSRFCIILEIMLIIKIVLMCRKHFLVCIYVFKVLFLSLRNVETKWYDAISIFSLYFICFHLICFTAVKHDRINNYHDVRHALIVSHKKFSVLCWNRFIVSSKRGFASDVRLSFNRRHTVRRGKGKLWQDKWNWSIRLVATFFIDSHYSRRAIPSDKVWNRRFVYL